LPACVASPGLTCNVLHKLKRLVLNQVALKPEVLDVFWEALLFGEEGYDVVHILAVLVTVGTCTLAGASQPGPSVHFWVTGVKVQLLLVTRRLLVAGAYGLAVVQPDFAIVSLGF